FAEPHLRRDAPFNLLRETFKMLFGRNHLQPGRTPTCRTSHVTDNDCVINDLVEDQVVIGTSDSNVNATIVRLCTDEGERAQSSSRSFDSRSHRRCCGWTIFSNTRENCGNVCASCIGILQSHAPKWANPSSISSSEANLPRRTSSALCDSASRSS